jgi:hypothetical protein
MKTTLIEEIRPFAFHWPSGHNEPYEVCYGYRVEEGPSGADEGEIKIAVGWRHAFGRDRRRILVFRRRQGVILETVGTDDFPTSGLTAWPPKRAGSNRSVVSPEDIPPEYLAFRVEPFAHWITGPNAREGYVALVREDDHEALIRLGLIREVHKRIKTVPNEARGAPAEGGTERLGGWPDGAWDTAAEAIVRGLAAHADDYRSEHLFRRIGEYTGQPVASPEEGFAALASPVASLSMLLGYYAFARQAAERAGYNEACVEILAPYRDEGGGERLWRDFPDWESFHRAFDAACMRRRIRPNRRINDGLVRELYALAARVPEQGLFHVWADRIRSTASVRDLCSELMAVHGIGQKIASFVCRDVVFLAGLEEALPRAEGRFLQPVDIWLGRVAEHLSPSLTFGKDEPSRIAQFLAEAARRAGVSGVTFNQGSWYFGSQVAGAASRLAELLAAMGSGGGSPQRGQEPGRPTFQQGPAVDSARSQSPLGRAAEGRPRRLVVVACGKTKVWEREPHRGTCPAREAYIGPFFSSNRRYADRFAPGAWMILSARFGFLRPDTPITDYNTTFLDPSTGPLEADQLRVSALQAGVTEYDEVEVLGGAEYVQRVREALGGEAVRILTPYVGCPGNGEMMGLAKAAVESGVPFDGPVVSSALRVPPRDEITDALASVRGPGRPSAASNPAFIRRAFELHKAHGLSQADAISQAAWEFGIELPPSYLRYPGVKFHQWRTQGYDAPPGPPGLPVAPV